MLNLMITEFCRTLQSKSSVTRRDLLTRCWLHLRTIMHTMLSCDQALMEIRLLQFLKDRDPERKVSCWRWHFVSRSWLLVLLVGPYHSCGRKFHVSQTPLYMLWVVISHALWFDAQQRLSGNTQWSSAQNWSLHEWQGFGLELTRRFTVQMLIALRMMKSYDIVHCDLKPEK